MWFTNSGVTCQTNSKDRINQHTIESCPISKFLDAKFNCWQIQIYESISQIFLLHLNALQNLIHIAPLYPV